MKKQISLGILAAYYDDTFHMYERGYISEAEFKKAASEILSAIGYPQSAIDTIVGDALVMVEIMHIEGA